jgi:hypothetical protein
MADEVLRFDLHNLRDLAGRWVEHTPARLGTFRRDVQQIGQDYKTALKREAPYRKHFKVNNKGQVVPDEDGRVHLRDSITYRTVKEGGSFIRLVVSIDAPHAGFVIGGTRPHLIRPSHARSQTHARRAAKARNAKARRGGKTRATLGPVLAFVVGGRARYARVVHHPGTRPNPFPERAWSKLDLNGRLQAIAANVIGPL